MEENERLVKALKKCLESPHGIHDGKLKTALFWLEKATPDKRARPQESRQAIDWLKKNGLWREYLNEYVRDKPKGTWGGKRQGAGWRDRERGEETVTVSCRIPLSERDAYNINSDWLKDAIQRKIASQE